MATTTTGPTFRVLVVDDSNTIRRSAEIFLKQGGHEVLLAEDGFDNTRSATFAEDGYDRTQGARFS